MLLKSAWHSAGTVQASHDDLQQKVVTMSFNYSGALMQSETCQGKIGSIYWQGIAAATARQKVVINGIS